MDLRKLGFLVLNAVVSLKFMLNLTLVQLNRQAHYWGVRLPVFPTKSSHSKLVILTEIEDNLMGRKKKPSIHRRIP